MSVTLSFPPSHSLGQRDNIPGQQGQQLRALWKGSELRGSGDLGLSPGSAVGQVTPPHTHSPGL